MFTIKGKLVHIGEIEILKNDMQKRDATIETSDGGKYPDQLSITFFGDQNVMFLDNKKVGDVVTIDYTTKVTEYNGRRYNNINARGLKHEALSSVVDSISLDDDLPF